MIDCLGQTNMQNIVFQLNRDDVFDTSYIEVTNSNLTLIESDIQFYGSHYLVYKTTESGSVCVQLPTDNVYWYSNDWLPITIQNSPALDPDSYAVGGLYYTTPAVTGITDVEYTTGSFGFTGLVNNWQYLDFTQNIQDGYLLVSITVKLGEVQGNAYMHASIYKEDTLEPFNNDGSHVTTQIPHDSQTVVHTGAVADVTFTWSQGIEIDTTKYYYFKIKESNSNQSPTISIDSNAFGNGGSGNILATLYHSTGITIPETTDIHLCD